MCELGRVSRAGYYRDWEKAEAVEAGMELRSQIQQISLSHRRYGYRRIRRALGRLGWVVNDKKVLRLMRLDNLLAVRKKKFVTTDSDHNLTVFPNLAPFLQAFAPDKIWVADITYIRLRQEFVFLAIVLDVYSRRVVGWALDRNIVTSLPLQALRQAIAQRRPAAGLMHHSDRGVQYASAAYVTELKLNHLVGSMSRRAYPYDNAFCESFMQTIKAEEIHCSSFSTMEELAINLTQFIEEYYNVRRLHSALGYLSPDEFERASAARENKEAASRRLIE